MTINHYVSREQYKTQRNNNHNNDEYSEHLISKWAQYFWHRMAERFEAYCLWVLFILS